MRTTPRLRTVNAPVDDTPSPPAAPSIAPADTTRHLHLVPPPTPTAPRRMRPTIACLLAAGITLPPH